MPNSLKKYSVGFLFDDTLDSADGVAQHVKLVGAWLSGRGHKVTYIVGQTKMKEWSGGKVISLARNLKVSFNGNKLSMPLLVKSNDIKNASKSDFDILHVMMPYSPLMSQRVISRAPAKTAVIGTFHIYPSGKLSSLGARILKTAQTASLKRISYFISVSPAAQEFAQTAFKINSTVIPNPVDLSAYKNAGTAKRQNGKKVVFLGRLVKRKGCHELVLAFNLLLKKMPSAELVIAGDGPQRAKLAQLAKRLGIADSVKFLGYIDESEKPRLLASADVACFPSLYGESFGIVLIEAMAAGAKTVLGGDNPGYRSVLGGYKELLVNPKNHKSFADRLFRLLTDKKLSDSIFAWQQTEVKKCDINVVGQQIEDVYTDAIARLSKKSDN